MRTSPRSARQQYQRDALPVSVQSGALFPLTLTLSLKLSIAHIYSWPYIIISLYHSHLCILWWDA
jgi:hypothetical protein